MHVQMDAPVNGRMLEFVWGIMLEILVERVQGHSEDTAKTNSSGRKLFHVSKSRMPLRRHSQELSETGSAKTTEFMTELVFEQE